MKYKFTKQQGLALHDMAVAAQYHALPANIRVQVKMPSVVVKALDELYPHVDRSQILTHLALDAVLRQLRFADNLDLAAIVDNEQSMIDDTLNYLEQREKHV